MPSMAKAVYYTSGGRRQVTINRVRQWFSGRYSSKRFGHIEKVVFHSTETTGFPGYNNGASAPNLTYNPRTREWRQHYRLDESSRALVNRYGGAQTNQDYTVQVEIIGYSDRGIASRVGGLPIKDLPSHAMQDLADFLAFMHVEWGLPLRTVSTNWCGFKYGTGAWQRMSSSAWDAYRGVLAHAHVPEGNTHWDPDCLNIAAILTAAKRVVAHWTGQVGRDEPREEPSGTAYTVVKGDTLSSIARKFKDVSWQQIASANGIKPPYTIQPGQKLVIPGTKNQPPPPPPPPPPAPPPAPAGKFPRVGDNKVWPDYCGWGQKDSDSVRCIQRALIGKGKSIPAGATGNFGPQTIAAIKSLTGGNGLVGPNTIRKILEGTPYQLQSGMGRKVRKWGGGKVYSGWVFYGNRNSESVRNVQQRLIDLGFSIPAGPTGNFFGQTKTAAVAFQRYVGLTPDGIVGPQTLRALFVAPQQHYLIVWGK